jgi:hypothetical protein
MSCHAEPLGSVRLNMLSDDNEKGREEEVKANQQLLQHTSIATVEVVHGRLGFHEKGC